MAAINLTEALLKADIKNEIKKTLCIGPAFELLGRIEICEDILHERLKNEFKDFLAHRTMIFSKDMSEEIQSAMRAFHEEIFK